MELTDEQRQLVVSVLDDLYAEGGIFEGAEKWEEFKTHILELEGDGQVFFDDCRKYKEKLKSEKFAFEFTLLMVYDMWLNNSAVWPVYNPEWEKKRH